MTEFGKMCIVHTSDLFIWTSIKTTGYGIQI